MLSSILKPAIIVGDYPTILTETDIDEEEKNLKRAMDLIEQMESQVDIFTLNRAIAILLERRVRSKPLWQNWLCKTLEDAEGVTADDSIRPLLPDLS